MPRHHSQQVVQLMVQGRGLVVVGLPELEVMALAVVELQPAGQPQMSTQSPKPRLTRIQPAPTQSTEATRLMLQETKKVVLPG